MIEILRGTPEEILWQATLVLHAIAAEIVLQDSHIVMSNDNAASRPISYPAVDLPGELVRHAARLLRDPVPDPRTVPFNAVF